jgi:hypothetical protein
MGDAKRGGDDAHAEAEKPAPISTESAAVLAHAPPALPRAESRLGVISEAGGGGVEFRVRIARGGRRA